MTTYKYLLTLLLTLFVSTLCFAQSSSKPLVIGKSDLLHSTILGEDRTINIYLPEDYTPSDTMKYPVVYVLDGGLEEDFIHIAGIVRFNTQPWIARFPRSIVVGIEGNTRRRDFTFAVSNTDFIEKEGFQKSSFPQYGGSAKYIQFLEKELQPYMEKTYFATGKKTVIGESLAGLFTTEILLKRPQLFDDYIIISPSLWWGDKSLLHNATKLANNNLKKAVNVYIGAPSKEEDVRMFKDAEKLFQVLKTNRNMRVEFDYMPGELHSTVIHQAVYNAFKILYPKTAYSE
ncbi:hypothetical protein LX64_00997 [Chitinophaga skermanii]|uniref:Alpha/beta superfamily hydrolase n=1 Tax=Chitinophaga skermanii TaxID=331697 RepID=A0A327QUQ5_9BACT|nr:alpha/beta hydrolase-fold protein [Chitinophaga skermanii]RAJ08349.1 hypothetical protein LX64_00997 [Chitinophaga skermanii]